MSEIDWTRVADLFADALELKPQDRAAFLAERLADRPGERAAVERLLLARDAADPGFLESLDPAYLEAVAQNATTDLAAIGPWRIVREIGHGGMGRVFLAERADGQFEQQVAIKLLKRGMDSDAIVARFLRERQILAGLEHPNIARLLDGGLAPDGRPYFVMEYVDGEPITEFADVQRLSIGERIALFRTVCDAVAYAHRSLVVHRDIKPSNVLVTSDGRPKLLDFGIAKLLSTSEDTRITTLTVDGSRLMTPAYAAPEQIHGLPITTATDVYGLGAVLFELLSGRPPFGHAQDRLRLPVDSEPSALTTAVERRTGEAGERTPEVIAAARSIDPARLRRRLSGDLETIVAAALRSAPERRYRSVDELDDDLRRHREQLPVRARPDTLGYRLSRFVGRHRYGVLATGAIAALVLAFGITASVQARAIALERDRAHEEATTARKVSEFLVGVFEVSDPMVPGASDTVRAADLLERGAERIETDLAGQPGIQARLLAVIGRAYGNLRRHDQAEPLIAEALELQRANAGTNPADVVATLRLLASVQVGRGREAEAEATLRDAIAIQETIDPASPVMWSLRVDLAYAIHATGDYQRGNAAVADALALYDDVADQDLGDVRSSLRRMAEMLGFGPDHAYQDSLFARLVEVERRTAGERSAPVAAALLAWSRASRARSREVADSLAAAATAIYMELDPKSLATAQALLERAGMSMDRVLAEQFARQAEQIYIDQLGEDHLQVAVARSNLADALQSQGRLEEAIAARRAANVTFRRLGHVLLPMSETALGIALLDLDRPAEAAPALESALGSFEANYPPDYILAANARRAYGEVLVRLRRPAEAEAVLVRAIEGLGKRWGENDYRVDIARISLGRALTDLGRNEEAEALLRAVVGRLTTGRGRDDELTRQAQEALDRLGGSA